MTHSHEHDHSDHHEHRHGSKNLLLVLILTTFYMFAEFIGGIYTNSLALTADAGHMLGDVAALALSYFAMWLASKPAPVEKTFGYKRAEIFAALINGVALVVIALVIVYEAYERMINPPEIKASVMLIIAFGGLIVNILGAILLHADTKENLNIKGAFLHIIGDLLGSVGAIISGLLIMYKQIYIADPIISIIIALLVLYSSINLTRNASRILMESAPKNINIEEVKRALEKVDGANRVHDLHIWSIDSSRISLSVHIVAKIENSEKILHDVHHILEHHFGICHSTIQIEPEGFHEEGCPLNLH